VQLHQTLNEREAQAQAAATAFNAVIGLRERLKDVFQHLRFNADTGVFNGEQRARTQHFNQTNRYNAIAVGKLPGIIE
jgi:hypothetical protein